MNIQIKKEFCCMKWYNWVWTVQMKFWIGQISHTIFYIDQTMYKYNQLKSSLLLCILL